MTKDKHMSVSAAHVVISTQRCERINIYKRYKTEVESIRKAIHGILHACEVDNIDILKTYYIINTSDIALCLMNRATNAHIRLSAKQSISFHDICSCFTIANKTSIHMDGTLMQDIIHFWVAGVIDIVHK